MTALEVLRAPSCWNVIGVNGDGSCPELITHVHCRNCPVFAAAGPQFLERPPPAGYREEWTERLAQSRPQPPKPISVLLFRVGTEWLALDTTAVVEVTEERPAVRVPHRQGQLLAGMVSLRGEVHLCVSLHGLFGLRRIGAPSLRRLLSISMAGDTWAVIADEVLGVHRFEPGDVADVPFTLASAQPDLVGDVFRWGDRVAGWLRTEALFAFLRRSTL